MIIRRFAGYCGRSLFRFGTGNGRFDGGFARINRLTSHRLGFHLLLSLFNQRLSVTCFLFGQRRRIQRIGFISRAVFVIDAFACGINLRLLTCAHLALRLFMTRFTRQLLALKTSLPRFETRFRLGGTLCFQIDGAQLGFFLTIILHQRNVARADIGAGTAFNAVINMVRAGFVVIAALAVPEELLRQQVGRAGIGAGATANTGLLFQLFAHLTGRRCQNAVADFDNRYIQRGQGKAHQRTAHDHHLVFARFEAHFAQQVADRRAEAAPNVSRAGNRFAGQGDHALGDRFAVDNGALNRPGGADVLHQHADIGGASAVRHLFTGENFGQLLGAAGRIFGGHHANRQIALFTQRLAQRSNCLRLVVFDANQHAFRLQHPAENPAAFQHFSRVILHQPVIGGDIGFAFGRIDYQRIDAAQAAF